MESSKEGETVMLPGVPQGVLFVKLFHLSFTHLFSYAFISQLYSVVKSVNFSMKLLLYSLINVCFMKNCHNILPKVFFHSCVRK
jgi:hypothetical protein